MTTQDPGTAASSQAEPTEPTTNPQPQAGVPPQTEPQAGDSQSASPDSMSLEEAKKLRQEANALRKRLKAFEDAEAKAAADKLTEQEKLQKQLADLQKAHDDAIRLAQETRISAEIRLQAQTLGIAPDLAEKLIDRTSILDDAGNPANVEDALKALVKTYPMLAGKPAAPTGGGATNPSKSQSSAPVALTRESITEMAGKRPEEYEARRPEIQAWLAEHRYQFGQR